MTTQKTVKDILNQPTNKNGSLKDTLWTTKGADMHEKGEIVIEIVADGYIVNGKHVAREVMATKGTQSIYEGGETIAQWLSYTSQGFASVKQQQTAQGGIVAEKSTIFDEENCSAEELEAYYIDMLKPAYPDTLSLASMANSRDANIIERRKAAKELDALLAAYEKELSAKRELSPEQQATLNNKRESEKRFSILYEAGLTNLKRAKAGYSARCSMIALADVMTILLNDYIVIGQPVYSIDEGNMTLSFRDKA